MKSREFSNFYVGLAGLVVVATSAHAYTYVVKKGNSLSKIAAMLLPGKVWGPQGSVQQILSLNPEIKNPNLILPGQLINMDAVLSRNQESCTNLERVPASVVEEKIASVVVKETPVTVQAQVAQAPVEVVAPSDSVAKTPVFKRGSLISISPRYSLSSISAVDNQSQVSSVLATKYNVGVDVSYIQQWTSVIRSFLKLSFAQLEFEQPTDTTRKISNANKFLSGVALGVETDLSSRSRVEVSAGYQKELFARATSTLSATADAVSIPSMGVKVGYDALILDPFAVGVSSEVLAKMPVNTGGYEARLGAQYGATIYIKQKVGQSEDYNFEADLGVTSSTQHTSLTQQKQVSVTLGLRFFFPVGRR